MVSDSESGRQRRSRRKRRPKTKGAPVSITDSPRILSEQHDYVTDQLSPHIGQEKYTLLVNTSDDMVTLRWQSSERTDGRRAKYLAAKAYPDKRGKKKLAASCSSTLTAHSLDAARQIIGRWCARHASWVYEIRPVSEHCGISCSVYFIFYLNVRSLGNAYPERTKPHVCHLPRF